MTCIKTSCRLLFASRLLEVFNFGALLECDSRWIPSSSGYWYCKPGPNISISSLFLVIQSFPVITIVNQYKVQAAKEEYKCKHF